MMKTSQRVALIIAPLCFLVLVGVIVAQGSPNYSLTWSVAGGSGGTSQSPHFVLSATAGQGAAGAAQSANYRLGGGFWYGFGMPTARQFQLYMPAILKQPS